MTRTAGRHSASDVWSREECPVHAVVDPEDCPCNRSEAADHTIVQRWLAASRRGGPPGRGERR